MANELVHRLLSRVRTRMYVRTVNVVVGTPMERMDHAARNVVESLVRTSA